MTRASKSRHLAHQFAAGALMALLPVSAYAFAGLTDRGSAVYRDHAAVGCAPPVAPVMMEALAGGLTSDPAAASWAPGRVDVFARGPDNALWHKWFDGQWRGWESLGGELASGPDVASWGPGRLDVFVRGQDGALWHKWFDGRWSEWESLGGTLTSDPTAVSWGPGRLDVFARGQDGALWHKWFDGRWSEWESLGGMLTSGPDVSSGTPGRLDVFVRGQDDALHHRWFDGRWSGWESLGGVLASDPSAISWGPGRIDVFARGQDDALWHKWFDGRWSEWESLGGALTSGPDASSWGSNRLDVFARGRAEGLYQKWYDGAWRDWVPLGVPVEQAALPGGTATAQGPGVWGFADLHVHQHNNLAFGGQLLWGQPFGRMDHALPWCTSGHGRGGTGDLFGTALALSSGSGGMGHKVGGYPQFDGWPRWNTFTHQQVYADWLKRAHDGGLQLMVMLAGNNPVLCEAIDRTPGRTCDDMAAVRLQIEQARAMERAIDSASGGPGRGWYRIVYTPKEARDAIGRGQLAVVLGAEVPTLFGCRYGSSCTPESVREELRTLRAMGLRQLNPIHNANNAFGGAAVYNDFFNLSNKALTGSYFSVRDCAAEGVEFKFALGAAVDQVNSLWSALLTQQYGPPSYPGNSHCNSLGLTSLGGFFVRELMHQKMVIDVDHMSWRALDATLSIAEQYRYPVVASHTGFLDISRGAKRSEGQKRVRDLQRIKALGGLVAPITFQGPRAETVNPASPIKHDCGNSSQSFAQAYLYAVWQMGFAPVALGSDFNGFAGQPSPRFGSEACNNGDKGSSPELNGRIAYPIPVFGVPGRTLVPSVVGSRTFDYNVDGLAHIGMLPDLIQDLRQQGVRDQELEPLFRSAEAYIRLWEKIEASAVPAPPFNAAPRRMVVTTATGPGSRGMASVVVTAVDAASNQPLTGRFSMSSGRGGSVSGALGETVYYAPCMEYDAEGRAWLSGECKGRASVAGYPDETFTVGS